MNNSDKLLMKFEIVNLLKSKSLVYVLFYLDDLIEWGSVVQVDYMFYIIFVCVYKNIVIDDYVVVFYVLFLYFGKLVEFFIFKV